MVVNNILRSGEYYMLTDVLDIYIFGAGPSRKVEIIK